MNQEPFWKTTVGDRLRLAPLVGMAGAFLLVAIVCILGLWNDLSNRSKQFMVTEVSNLQPHVERTVIRIEAELRDGKSINDYQAKNIPFWLADHWERMIINKPNRIYASVENAQGDLLACAGRMDLFECKPLSREQVDEFPRNVQRVGFGKEQSHLDAIEIAMPITMNDHRVGTYRTAIPVDWLDQNIGSANRSRWLAWLAVLAAMSLIVSVTALFLFRLGAHSRDLEQALKTSETKRLADLSKLVISMAHELRNPLNSIRLNLFTSEKLIRGDSPIDQDEAVAVIHESVSEIERVNELIGQLLGFVKADDPQDAWLNLDNEIQSLLQFLKPTHEHHQIDIDYHPSRQITLGKVSKKYFRQILINLLQNARQAMPQGGSIRLKLNPEPQALLLSIEDSGPGVASTLFEKIFEPFYSTSQDGAGLGLAVVRNLIEASGGSVSCQRSSELGGLKFTLRFQTKSEPIPSMSIDS
jgi:signal transduction histidine kinase